MNAVKKTAEVETKEVIPKNITLTEITFRHSGLEAKANAGSHRLAEQNQKARFPPIARYRKE